MAAKKAKSSKTTASKVKAPAKTAKKVVKKVTKKASGLLGKIAQRSAQLVLDSGLLGDGSKRVSKRAPAKKSRRRA